MFTSLILQDRKQRVPQFMRQTLVHLVILILLVHTVEWYYTKQRQLLNDDTSKLVVSVKVVK